MNHKGLSRAFTLSALFAAMLPAMQANAAAFQVAEQSAAGIGRANAGEAAMIEDASVVARNVAGIAFLDKPMFTGAVSYIKPNINVENTTSGTSGLKQEDVAQNAVVPVFYYVAPINDKLSYGVGGFTNFGFVTEYDVDSGMTLAAETSDVMSYNLNASLAYKLRENLSVGFGLSAVYVEAHLSNVADLNSLGLGYRTAMDMKGDDWSYGWHAGVFWEPMNGTRIGLNYSSEVKTTLEGKGKSDPIPGSTLIPDLNSDGAADLDLPSIMELSIWQKVNDKIAVHASYMKIGWSSFDILRVDMDNGETVQEIHEYSDVSRWAVGATYQYDDQWTLRTGYAYDNSPVSNEHRSFRIPDGDRQWFSVGASYKIDQNQKVDLGYAYLTGKENEIHYTSSRTGTQVDGEITKSNAHILSLQYNYKF